MVAAKKSQKQKWERANYIVKLIAHSIFPKDTCPQLLQPLKYMPPLHKNRCFSQFKKHATFLDQKKTRCFSRLKKMMLSIESILQFVEIEKREKN